jgi:hypothetical protein
MFWAVYLHKLEHIKCTLCGYNDAFLVVIRLACVTKQLRASDALVFGRHSGVELLRMALLAQLDSFSVD